MKTICYASQRHAVNHSGGFVRTSRHFGFLIRRVETSVSWDAPPDDEDSEQQMTLVSHLK